MIVNIQRVMLDHQFPILFITFAFTLSFKDFDLSLECFDNLFLTIENSLFGGSSGLEKFSFILVLQLSFQIDDLLLMPCIKIK